MKKTYLVLIGVLLIGTILAISFAAKEEMLSYFRTYKQERESNIKDIVSTITYITDKECEIEYYLEEIFCEVCFKYTTTIDKEASVYQDCIRLDEESTEQEDDETIRQYVREALADIFPIEEIKYKARDMEGRQINLK